MIPVLLLPDDIRFDFARPRAPVYSGDFTWLIPRSAPSLACVGDVVSRYCSKIPGVNGPMIMLIDGKTRRSIGIDTGWALGLPGLRLVNPAGSVALPAMRRICEILSSGELVKLVIEVEGEEDMLALPSIACSPEGGYVVYGIPGRGASVIRVDKRARIDAQLRILLLRPGTAGLKH